MSETITSADVGTINAETVANGEAEDKRVDEATFIRVWEASSNEEEVAEKLKLKIGTVQQRSSLLRNKKGIPLKKFKPSVTTAAQTADPVANVKMLAEIRGIKEGTPEFDALVDQAKKLLADSQARKTKRAEKAASAAATETAPAAA